MNAVQGATTLWELLQARAAKTPDAPMLIDTDERVWSFAAVARETERVAAGLRALGVTRGSKVTWQLPTRADAVFVSLALCRLEAIQNPVIHLYGRREVSAIVEQFRPAFYLVPADVSRSGAGDPAEWVADASAGFEAPPRIVAVPDDIDAALAGGDVPPPSHSRTAVAPHPDVVAARVPRWVYYTSGTTAAPKGVLHSDATLLASGREYGRALGLNRADVGAIAFPYAHVGGTMNIVMLLDLGMSAVLLAKFSAEAAAALYRRHGVTQNSGSVAHYTAFLAEQRRQPAQPIVPTLRLLSGGGAAKPANLFFEARAELRCTILHCYGMTEAPMVTSASPAHTDEQLAATDGLPVSGMQIKILRADGTRAAPGESGDIWIRGDTLCHGYSDPALTAQGFDAEGFFNTGDVGQQRADGHIVLTGRSKDIIIRKGENISAREIEDLLGQHPKVAAVAVIGLPDAERGERVCAVIESCAPDAPLSFAEMRTFFEAAGIMRQKIPEQLEIVERMPRNETFNKILKFKLREQFAAAPSPAG
ncbi:MAG: class I adenylate-forming enzyme family protein [Janthinobacterium lividum]